MFAAHPAVLTTDDNQEGRPVRALDPRLQLLAAEYYDFVWRSLRRLGVSPPETDDATQQVFLILSHKLSAVREGSERSYIFSIVMRVASKARRAKATTSKREVPESDAPEPPSTAATAEASLGRAQARVMLDEILAGLSEERRVVFVLFELEELTKPEIANLLEIPVGTVSSRLRRAREDFEAAVARLHAKK
ncbi:RNA polymerase sigma factor RpoE [Labilithrix luteola]|uniref:RNA polymerase sigma factor RpoE n=1 Tax=Labilithrix luteola TaxID=1391654 RepID=A0A0K1PPM3_9BACT|nr:sigma-70 family RNA polymerase sigma factor [Labilithrix luteola]AKU95074.1 RNA polymerase sigma factor RpoE [Labilithrix luteola]